MMKIECIGDEEKNASMTNVFFIEKRAIYDLVSSQESLVSNLKLQNKQLRAQVACLEECVARLEREDLSF